MNSFFLVLIFILVLVIFVVLLSLKSSILFEIRALKKQLKVIKDQIIILNKGEIVSEKQISLKVEQNFEEIRKDIKESVDNNKKTIITEKYIQPEKKETKKKVPKNKGFNKIKPLKEINKKIDIEKFIGENLINKIGIFILLIAIAYFIKYAIGEGWINEFGRVAIGLLVGSILIGIGHMLRKNYKAFSSVLVGGGIATYYFSIALGFQLYHLFSQSTAFVFLIVITAIAIILALIYDRMELALLAIIGGFATPLMVSTGTGNYKVLFTYILILDIGMLVLANFKKWNLINIVSYVATVLLYGSWLSNAIFNGDEIPYKGAFLFASLFYLLFLLMNIIYNLKKDQKFSAFDIMMLITDNFFFYVAGMYLLNLQETNYQGLFTVILAIINGIFALSFNKKKRIDRNLILIFFGLFISFISLIAPSQFKGNYITLFWAVEACLLVWYEQKAKLKLLRQSFVVVTILMVISLLMDWSSGYNYINHSNIVYPIIFNRIFITGMGVVVSMFISIVFLYKTEIQVYFWNISTRFFSNSFKAFFIIILYFTLLLEIVYQTDRLFGKSRLTTVAVSFFNYLYLLLLLIWIKKEKAKLFIVSINLFAFLYLLIYTFIVSSLYRTLISQYLSGNYDTVFSFLHFLTVFLILGITVLNYLSIKNHYKQRKILVNLLLWINAVLIMIILSKELEYCGLLIVKPEYDSIKTVLSSIHKIGWPVLWSVLAFAFMFVGMKVKQRNYRVLSLTIFLFTILKLFIIDVRDMSKLGVIISFSALGIILLLVSFLYQKLKKIIFEDYEIKPDKLSE